jgi:ABC-type amino acid transport system permease subunit
MSIITFLAKDRFNHIDAQGLVWLCALVANGLWGWAVAAWVIGLLASVLLRVFAEEQRQRTGEPQQG